MRRVGGNASALFKVRETRKNDIGEQVVEWVDAQTIWGFLDLSGGDSRYNNFQTKAQESTHVFVANRVNLDKRIAAETSRAIISGKTYDVTMIDDPMGLGYHFEIYLRLVES